MKQNILYAYVNVPSERLIKTNNWLTHRLSEQKSGTIIWRFKW
jgi:hypothetical protein